MYLGPAKLAMISEMPELSGTFHSFANDKTSFFNKLMGFKPLILLNKNAGFLASCKNLSSLLLSANVLLTAKYLADFK